MIHIKTVFCLYFLFTISYASLETIELTERLSAINLKDKVEYYEDSQGLLSVKDIRSSAYTVLFNSAKNSSLNFGYTRSSYWIRLKLKGNSNSAKPFIIKQGFANTHYIDFYQFAADTLVKSVKTGVMRPTQSRDIQSNTFAFLVTIPAGDEHLIYMRFKNDASMTIRLSLYTWDKFFNNSQFIGYLFGAFIGILMILILYDLFIYFSLWDLSYLYFSLAIASLGLFFLSYSGIAYVHIWPDQNTWNVYAVAFFNNLIILTFLKFTQSFLLLKRNSLLLFNIMNVLLIAAIINIILLPLLGFFIVIQSSIYLTLVAFSIMLTAGIYAIKIGYGPAKYFVVSFGGLIIQAIILIAVRLGFLEPNINSDYGFTVTTFFLIILLSQGLASRINVLKEEKDRINKQFLDSEERFKAIVETTNDFIWEVNKDGEYSYVSPNVIDMLGYGPDELVGKTPFDLMPAGEAKIIKKEFEKVVKTKLPIINLVNINKMKNGKHVVLETRGVPFFDKDNNLLGYRGVDRNITKRKKAEEALAKSENNLRALLNATSDIAFLTDLNLNVIALNEAYRKILEKDTEEIIGKNTLSFLNTKLANLRKKKIDLAIKSGQAITWEDKGEMGIYENNVYPIFDKNGKITNLAFYIIDITKKKHSEEQIRILSTSIEQSPFSIILFTKKGDISYANPKTVDVTGYSIDELTAMNIKSLQPELPVDKMVFDVLAGKEVKGEYQVRKKDGNLYWESINMFSIKDENNQITHLIAINEDISTRKSLEGQLIQAQKMEAVGTLAGGIAHDFNNLLTIISGYSDLVLEKIQDKKFRHYIANIHNASRKAEDLTRQILAFSKKQVFQPQIIDVNDLLINLNKMIPRLIGEDIRIELNLSDTVDKIKADPSQYEQIVLNLIVNARDAINHKKENRDKKQISINTENVFLNDTYTKKHVDVTPGKYVCLSVTDTGIGMSKDIQEQVFEPFFTTKEQGKGTGLGLATVFGIVKQNGGNIYLYSEPKIGSTFRIFWPASDKDITYKKDQKIDNKKLAGSEKILFVEDSIEILNFAKASLTEYGYSVLSAQNGNQALELINKNGHTIDVLITDVTMPDMNGKELSKKMSKIIPKVKVIFISGYTDDHIVHGGELASNVNFIQKPFTINQLLTKIRDVLDKK